MNNNQENKSRMYLTTQDFLTDNDTVVKGLPNFTVLFTGFKTVIGKILTEDERLQMSRNVKSDGKNVYKFHLAQLGADMSSRIVAWANFNKEIDLIKQLSFSESLLKKMPDVVLRDTAQGLYHKANDMVGALTTYGVTDVSLAELQTAIDEFTNVIPKPRLVINQKKELNINLTALFKEADKYLADIDILIEMVKITNSPFYREYKSARLIVVLGKRTIAVRGEIYNEQTKKPIEGATIELVGEGGFFLTKKSAAKGGFKIKELPEGTYQVTVSMIGFTTKTVTILVSQIEMTVLEVMLTPIAAK